MSQISTYQQQEKTIALRSLRIVYMTREVGPDHIKIDWDDWEWWDWRPFHMRISA